MTAAATTEVDQLRTWLVERVAHYTDTRPQDIDPAAPLTSYGLDSVYALMMCGEIEDHLPLRVEPTVVWDYRTIDDLAAYLIGAVEGDVPTA